MNVSVCVRVFVSVSVCVRARVGGWVGGWENKRGRCMCEWMEAGECEGIASQLQV